MAPVLRRTWVERLRELIPWLSFVAFYAIFANVPYWVASREFEFSRLGSFCIQYATVGLIALVVPRYLASFLLFAVIFADMLSGICQSYGIPIRECVVNFRAADAFPGARLVYAFSVLLLALLTAATAALLPVQSLTKKQKWLAAACLAAFGVLILGADIRTPHIATSYLPSSLYRSFNSDRLDVSSSQSRRLARLPIFQIVRSERLDAAIRAKEEKDEGPQSPVPSASEVAVHAAGIMEGNGNRELPNLVLVIVESWGLSVNAPLREALIQPYQAPNLLAKYEVVQGTVPFYGATIAGEARELCGSSIGFYVARAPARDLQGCLPDRLAALGYRGIAVHGMSGYLFDRAAWYKTMGFQETWFRNAFKQQGLPDCIGMFVGTCDADIAAWIGRRLEQDASRPYFFHWTTLNSHLPVPVPTPFSDVAPCTAAISVAPDTALCSWYQLVVNLHRSVAQVAMRSLARPTVFVLVGDHAPPFGDPAVRSRFSQTDVPYMILLPRSNRGESKSLLAHEAISASPRADNRPRQTQ
jgi:phosphoglycerol transferase MdoB-like AlkP superfamily enzyme